MLIGKGAGSGGELDGQFVEFLLFLALNFQIVGAAFFVVKTVERFAVARGDEHFLPDGVDFEARLLEGGGALLQAEFQHIAPGARILREIGLFDFGIGLLFRSKSGDLPPAS